jgi:parallel beta-helix repeat protein
LGLIFLLPINGIMFSSLTHINHTYDTKNLKAAVVADSIFINDFPGSLTNWSWAVTQSWFGGGSGTEQDPYLLEDLIIDGNTTDNCITIMNSEAYFEIIGCTLTNSRTGTNGAIYLYNASNAVISGNLIANNSHGIYLDGSSSSIVIYDNEIYGDTTGTGIVLWDVDGTIVSSNTIKECWQGIWVYTANNTSVIGNEASNNLQNGVIILQNSYHTFVSGNELENNVLHGIYSIMSYESIIENNLMEDNQQTGIYLENSDVNTITGNTIKDNDLYGVLITPTSDNNLFFGNYFINNTDNAVDNGVNNNWNNTVLGNYWDDYLGFDMNLDGIGDTPYDVPPAGGSLDLLPIWNKQAPIVINDLPSSSNDWAWAETQAWCSGSGTELDPYIIEGLNIDANETDSPISIWHSRVPFIIQGCSLNNSASGSTGGVFLTNVTNGHIVGNSFYNHRNAGVYGVATDYITVAGNTFENHQHGVYLGGSYNEILGNTFFGDGSGSGVIIQFSPTFHDNTIDGNRIENCWQGIFIFDSDNNTVSGNIILKNLQHGIAITGVAENNLLVNNILLNNSLCGIILDSGLNNIIEHNRAIENNQHGIYIINADFTTIYYNIIVDNAFDGVRLDASADNNLIYRNFFGGNGRHAYDAGTLNDWNSTTIGNYWDNHTGPDSSPADGIVDNPYTFIEGGAGSIDYLPIAEDGPPVIVINSPVNGATFAAAAPSFTVTVSDAFILDMWYSIGGDPTKYFFSSNGTIDQTAWDALPQGTITITFYANDTGGNLSSESVNIVKSLPTEDSSIIIIVIVVSIVSGIAVVSAILLLRRLKARNQP